MDVLFKRLAPVLSLLWLAGGAGLYFYSAALYSQATSRAAVPGYRHFANYWCELYNDVTFTGESNAGGFYARASTLALVGSLFFFWLAIPALFARCRRLALTVRIAGGLASVAASLVFTDLHDMVITLAAPLGFAAILATCLGLARRREAGLFLLAIVAVAVSLCDYLAWKLNVWQDTQPLIQKCAIGLVFLWVLAGSVRVLLLPRRSPVEPASVEPAAVVGAAAGG